MTREATPPIRVLVIDDSAYSRQTITRALESSPLVEVVGTARDGEEALRKAFDLEPDLITLDLEMPRMDGFTFLRLLMARAPTPVIVVSSRVAEDEVFKALDLGAADFIAKPTPHATPELGTIRDELIRKVHAIRELRVAKLRERARGTAPVAPPAFGAAAGGRLPVVAIGCSTGGPAALMEVFGAFSEPPPCAFLVAQHMPAGFTRGFADRLARLSCFAAAEARGGEPLSPGTLLVAPGGRHLGLERVGEQVTTRVWEDPAQRYVPCVDVLFRSAAKHLGAALTAVVLTGMGDDGRAGVQEVKAAGGAVLAESEESAVIFGMPKQAAQTGAVDRVLSLSEMPAGIARAVRETQERGERGGA